MSQQIPLDWQTQIDAAAWALEDKPMGDVRRELKALIGPWVEAFQAEIDRLQGVAHGFVDEIGEKEREIAALKQRIGNAQESAEEMRSQLVNGPELQDVLRIIAALNGED